MALKKVESQMREIHGPDIRNLNLNDKQLMKMFKSFGELADMLEDYVPTSKAYAPITRYKMDDIKGRVRPKEDLSYLVAATVNRYNDVIDAINKQENRDYQHLKTSTLVALRDYTERVPSGDGTMDLIRKKQGDVVGASYGSYIASAEYAMQSIGKLASEITSPEGKLLKDLVRNWSKKTGLDTKDFTAYSGRYKKLSGLDIGTMSSPGSLYNFIDRDTKFIVNWTNNVIERMRAAGVPETTINKFIETTDTMNIHDLSTAISNLQRVGFKGADFIYPDELAPVEDYFDDLGELLKDAVNMSEKDYVAASVRTSHGQVTKHYGIYRA